MLLYCMHYLNTDCIEQIYSKCVRVHAYLGSLSYIPELSCKTKRPYTTSSELVVAICKQTQDLILSTHLFNDIHTITYFHCYS